MNEKTVKQEKELSAARDTFASTLFNEGARLEKERVLNVLPEEFARLHRSGAFHITTWMAGISSTTVQRRFLNTSCIRSICGQRRQEGALQSFSSSSRR